MTDVSVVAHCRDLIGESPIWCERTARLWWVDVLRPALHNLNMNTGEVATTALRDHRVGCIALCEQGGLLIAGAKGIDMFNPTTGFHRYFTGGDQLGPNHCFNDGRCDRQGRFWVGSMSETFTPDGKMFRVDPNGAITEVFGEVIVPNGVAFSPDSLVMYFADTRRYTIWSFDFDPDHGILSNRRVFAQITGRSGRPDGSCVDSAGFIWNAEYAGGQIVRYAPDGRIDRVYGLPISHPTSLCFGGTELDTLFITSGCNGLTPEQIDREPLSGAVLAFKPGVTGLPESRFDG